MNFCPKSFLQHLMWILSCFALVGYDDLSKRLFRVSYLKVSGLSVSSVIVSHLTGKCDSVQSNCIQSDSVQFVFIK